MTPYYSDETVTLYLGDVLDVLPELPAASIAAVVTDPPYGLEFMGREWDSFKPTSGRGSGAQFANGSVGGYDGKPMPRHGKRWRLQRCAACGRTNGGGSPCTCAAPQWVTTHEPGTPLFASTYQRWCEAWASECLRVLKPGGHLLAFGGTRTAHRLTSAIEDAGFEIRDSIVWLYGQGFPKSLDVSRAIDKTRRRDYVLAAIDLGLSVPGNNLHDWTKAEHSPGDAWWERFKAHLPAEDWSRIERAVVNRRESGSAAGRTIGPIGIKGGEYDITTPATDDAVRWSGWGTALKPAHEPIVVARKPLAGTVAGNVLEYGTGALNVDACRTEAGQDYRDKCGSVVGLDSNRNGDAYGEWTGVREDSAHAAGRWPTNVVLSHAPDCADKCVPGCPVGDLDGQSGFVKAGGSKRGSDAAGRRGGMMGEPVAREVNFDSYGDFGGASRFFPVFRYEPKAPTVERPRDGAAAHPTVKPLDLMRWLVRLVTPPGGLVLDPFAGSGTTGEACVIEGFRCVLVEREPAYLPLIVARLSKPIQAVLPLGEVAS